MSIFLSKSSIATQSEINPSQYTIQYSKKIGIYTIMKIKYHNFHNYEGVKILVFDRDISKQKIIDPHFLDDKKYVSPIARFEPTEEGWNNAVMFVTIKNK